MTKALKRIAILSVHTSPLHQPGFGDAGGMNVYIAETAKRIAAQGIEVEIFTRATSAHDPESVELAPGVLVRHVASGPFEGLSKEELPGQLCAVTAGLLRAEAAKSEGFYDLIHSHYWLSGQVGWLAKERWNVPLVHTMHTMARVKNAALATGDSPEPVIREIGEEQVVSIADALVANTEQEAGELVELYHAQPHRVHVVNPGVDLTAFRPGNKAEARKSLGINENSIVLLFVGRIQPLKAPDVLLKAAAQLLQTHPQLKENLVVAVCGGPSGSGLDEPEALQKLSVELGIESNVKFLPPTSRSKLPQVFQAADLCIVPSHNESFGLVAVEAQACSVPVIATRVGGLITTVADGRSGILVTGHAPEVWAETIWQTLSNPDLMTRLQTGALGHAQTFSWDYTAKKLLETYREVIEEKS